MISQLPYELLEGSIFYYLNGKDLVNLSNTCQTMKERLYSISILCSLHIKADDIWPCLTITHLGDNYTDLAMINLKFPKISITSAWYPKVFDHLPSYYFLECILMETHFEQFQPIEKFVCHKLVCKELWNNNLELMMNMKHLQQLTVHASLANDSLHIQQYISKISSLEIDGFAECDFISLCPHLSKLTTLKIRHTLTDVGAMVLAEHLPFFQLESLLLEGNYLTKDGLAAISQILKKTKLKELNLVGNEFDITDLEILFNVLPSTGLNRVLV
ncbi:hypothetical protein HDV04_000310 [Boothiomyces sp. JEL0838]|nr:hypothetical protein HDV04_000310 [Boothiomyces sp. JEL0838]